MDKMKHLGQLIDEGMRAKGMAAYELAAVLGRQPSYVSRLVNGQNANLPDAAVMDALSRALDVPKRRMLEVAGYLDPVTLTEKPDVLTLAADDPRAELVTLLEGYPAPALNVIVATVREIAPAIRRNVSPLSDSASGT